MRLAVLSAAVVLMASAAANATTAQDPQKVCLDRYNVEKSGGTIPVGMSKSTYMRQCTGSIRRAAKLEKQLGQDGADAGSDGTNVVTVAPGTARPATQSKPVRVKTTIALGTQGQ